MQTAKKSVMDIPTAVTNGEVSLKEWLDFQNEWLRQRTIRTLVITSICSIVGLILLALVLGLIYASDKAVVIQNVFLAISGFSSSIGAVVIMAFLGINKEQGKSTGEESRTNRNYKRLKKNKMKKFILSLSLLLFSLIGYSQIPIVDNFVDLLKVPDGDTIQLKPGSYSGTIVLKERYSSETVFVLYSVHIDAKDQRFAIDMQGKNITFLMKDSKITGGKDAGIGHRGDYCKIIATNTLITDNNFGMRLVGTNHHIEGLTFRGQKSTGITGNNKKLNPKNREVAFGFHYGPVNNWRITRCKFYDIFPPVPGDAGGAIRIIPYAHTVVIDSNYFENIGGSVVWGDHNQKEFYVLNNVFKNIPNKVGKCVFLEIFDPRPDETSGRVAMVAGNVFKNVAKHTILVAASSGQNPGGIEIFGNTIESGWGIIAGAMERRFARRFEKNNPADWQWVNARLENIHIHHNVIRPTTGRNHGAFYKGQYGGKNIVWDNNYYVTGHQYRWEKPNGLTDKGTIEEGKIYQGGDKMNPHGFPIQTVSFYDKNAIVGPMPTAFPFPEVLKQIPNLDTGTVFIPDFPDYNDSTGVDPPKDSTTTTPVPTQSKKRKRVIITSDFSNGLTDWDDWEALALSVMYQEDFDLVGIILGSHKADTDEAATMAAFERKFHAAYKKAVPALNAKYNGAFDEKLTYMFASSNGRGFVNEPIDTSKLASTKFIVDNITEDDTLLIYWWGTGGEAANASKWIIDNRPELIDNFAIISHAASLISHNNRRKDSKAASFIENENGKKYNNYFSFGFSGKVIDGRHSFPLVKIDDHGTDIGTLTYYKHTQIRSGPKTDGSDGSLTFISLVDKFGGGWDYLWTLKRDGSSNESKLRKDFENLRPEMFPHISKKFEHIASWDGTIPDPVIPDPDPIIPKDSVTLDIQELEDKLKDIKSYIDDVLRKLEQYKSSSSINEPKIIYDYKGIADGNIIIKGRKPQEKEIYNFEEFDFNGFNLRVESCSNIVVLSPKVFLKDFDNNCIKIDDSEDVILYRPQTKRGGNGVKITNLSTRCLVYEGRSDSARIDAFTFHKADYPCGDENVLYKCKGSGGEQSVDITSGKDHLIAYSSGAGLNGIAMTIGHGASCSVVNFTSPDQIISIKETPGVILSNLQVKGITLRKQGTGNGYPSNIQLYGEEPIIKNVTGLALSQIYSHRFGEFESPLMARLNKKLTWISGRFQ